MAIEFKSTIHPLPVPEFVYVRVGGAEVTVPIAELDTDTLAQLAEQFTLDLFKAAGKELK